VRTAVHVQHLPGDVTSFSQIHDRLSDVLRLRDRAHRGKGLHEVPRSVLVKRGIDNARRDRIEPDIVLGVFTRQAEGDGIKSALGDHRHRCRKARDGVLKQRRRDGRYAAAGALQQHLLDRELGDEEEPFQVRGGEAAKLVGGVVREGLGYEDARIVDDMVDRAELSDRGLCDLLRGRCLTNVSVKSARFGEDAKSALETLREVAATL
jgi:hypothetical protein